MNKLARESNYDPTLDPTVAMSRAVIVAERLYTRIANANDDDAMRADILLLLAHLRAARKFVS